MSCEPACEQHTCTKRILSLCTGQGLRMCLRAMSCAQRLFCVSLELRLKSRVVCNYLQRPPGNILGALVG